MVIKVLFLHVPLFLGQVISIANCDPTKSASPHLNSSVTTLFTDLSVDNINIHLKSSKIHAHNT